MNWNHDRPAAAAAIAPPETCPACTSPSISTTERHPDEHTYWRCGTCGEVWNHARREVRPNAGRAWR